MAKHGVSDWRQLVERANSNIGWYWDAVNEDLGIEWFRKYDMTYDSSAGIPWTKWFINGRCNIVSNAIDRHAKNQPNKIAYIFSNESDSRKITYHELDEQVSRLAGALIASGIKKGDVVAIYLSMIPEAFYAILACSKIGAVHTTIFSGFSAQALHSRLVDSRAKMLITTGAVRRRGKEIDLSSQWQMAVQAYCPICQSSIASNQCLIRIRSIVAIVAAALTMPIVKYILVFRKSVAASRGDILIKSDLAEVSTMFTYGGLFNARNLTLKSPPRV